MFKNVTLEISLKPFYRTDEEHIRKVCREVFDGWRALLRGRERVSIMMWTSDGSEILDYAGNLEDRFEWDKYVGTANGPLLGPDEPSETSLHKRCQLYRPDAPEMTYGILKRIVEIFREEGERAFPEARIRVGETFDIGPEFAVSDFKYRRHPEICTGTKLDKCGFVDCTATLAGDDRAYAAYPDGIPDGTPFGTFFGRQSQVFLHDMGFDFLWLSNGLGFSAEPWSIKGKIYDGERFYPEKLAVTKKRVFDFWRLFREACPEIPLEVRGTNNSVGIDYATDGVPLYDIYRGNFGITPPPNSPWAAINDNYGLEIMGHMTRICDLPAEGFMFRYYLHDPWWINSPWYDRYDGAPTDIYLPMAISRVDRDGKVESASTLNILSIDNSMGEMPESCINEPIPHLLKADKNAADAPAPIVWVYPMREYTTAEGEAALSRMYFGDGFIRDAINSGFPLCCVTSTDNFLEQSLEIYGESILLSPVPETEAVRERLREFSRAGGRVLFYGYPHESEGLSDIGRVVDMTGAPSALREALEDFGYCIRFACKPSAKKPPTMTVSRSDNGFFFSVYNSDTTTDTDMKFPLGAPILSGGETELCDGFARYRFSRCEHRECRIFVEQKNGVVSCHEKNPNSMRFRRRIQIGGLEDATVRFFPEAYCREEAYMCDGKITPDSTPILDPRLTLVHDPIHGTHFRAEHVTGDLAFLLPRKR